MDKYTFSPEPILAGLLNVYDMTKGLLLLKINQPL
jgi:hypothetical protein